VAFIVWFWRAPAGPKQPVEGAIFVTGCDSGMGKVSAERLAKLGYHVFMGCYLPTSVIEINATKDSNKTAVLIDVTNDESVKTAVTQVENALSDHTKHPVGLIGIVNCAGVAFEGPCEYLPMSLFQRQLEVNLIGYVRTTQALMPLVKRGATTRRRGRVLFVGTGGGVPAACPPIVGAYMASKWGVEAYQQAFRLELQLRNLPIDACMINPGVIKPTGLEANGQANLEKAWSMMPPQAKAEYGEMVNAFVDFMTNEKGSPPSMIADAVESAFEAYYPDLRYKVGLDSNLSPWLGVAPSWFREMAIRKSIFAKYKVPS